MSAAAIEPHWFAKLPRPACAPWCTTDHDAVYPYLGSRNTWPTDGYVQCEHHLTVNGYDGEFIIDQFQEVNELIPSDLTRGPLTIALPNLELDGWSRQDALDFADALRRVVEVYDRLVDGQPA